MKQSQAELPIAAVASVLGGSTGQYDTWLFEKTKAVRTMGAPSTVR